MHDISIIALKTLIRLLGNTNALWNTAIHNIFKRMSVHLMEITK